jgi:hypothetical protein
MRPAIRGQGLRSRGSDCGLAKRGRESPRGRLEDAGASKGLQRMKLKRKVAVARATSPVHYLASDSFAEKYEKLTYEHKQIICDEIMRILAEREGEPA